jgi:hypothetical protein
LSRLADAIRVGPIRSGFTKADHVGCFRYRLFDADGSEIGEAEYPLQVCSGDTVWTLDGRELRVTALVPLENKHSLYTALLQVQTA